ncbi:MAG: hypothetical protein HY961_05725 [Ignavibacteriae bacterium]|nr:hypothetical protein [Ignavibacteriota bacterium]
MNNRIKLQIACVLVALVIVPMSLLAQTAPATSVFNYPGAGVIQAGDTWESFLPQGTGVTTAPVSGINYSEVSTAPTLGVRRLIQMGNFDRGWTTPATHWPAGFPITPYWLKDAFGLVYDPDTTWNRSTIGGTANPSYFAIANAYPGATYSNFAYLTFKSTLNGAGDPTRRYSVEPYFVDGTTRQHVVYEAGWPTSLGVDVKIRAHGIAGPNWNNLNDYVIVEIQMKNTGFLDMNMDGVAEQINHDIKALAFQIEEQAYMSISSYACGGRCVNDIVPTISARQAAWVDDADPDGNPWAFSMVFPSATTVNPVPGTGNTDIGFNGGTTRNYMDIKHGWVMLDVKSGGLPASRAQSTASLPSKLTIFNTHPIGAGTERGWYVSGGSSYWVGALSDPRKAFYATTGVWYQNGGQLSHNTDFTALNLAPNSNFFASGTTGDPISFVPKVTGYARPNGDYKSTNHFDQVSFEDGSANATTQYPNGWGKWTKGAAHTENFDDDMFSGLGPFSLKKDSTITIVFATVAGYRLEGIQRSVRAARYAYQNSFTIPKPPPLPDMKVSNTLNKSVILEWNNAAATDPEFAGYKIWKASQFKKLNWLEEGMRVVDQYEQQMAVGPRPANVYKPVNPKFDAQAKMLANSTKGTYQPDTWGTWDLVKVIPKAEVPTLPPATTAGYNYKYEDKEVVLGFQYWYYISAYKEGTYTGPGGETTTRIETHYTNRNGGSGLWNLTYPFAYNNANFPKDATGLKNIGALQVVTSALARPGIVSAVGVRPNPYKRAALHDNRSQVYDHKLLFYNLPPQAKITILDVSGQIIDVINFASTDPSKGSIFWDMFSKDGIEVASGLYIYVVESGSNSYQGYFSILR